MTKSAFLFDLDMTLLDTSVLKPFRDAKQWGKVKENISSVEPFPRREGIHPHQIPALLKANDFPVAIVTSSPKWYAATLLKEFKIKYDVLVAYDDTPAHKPDPAPLKFALEKLGNPKIAYHIGDQSSDTEASYHAQVISIGAAWGMKDEPDFWKKAPDIMLFHPPFLLDFYNLRHYGYIGEVLGSNKLPNIHQGSVLRWEEDNIEYFALGRYFPTGDSRHASSALSRNILTLKDKDSIVEFFALALQHFVECFGSQSLIVVCVPPKPGQRNRFEGVLKLLKTKKDNVKIVLDGLRTIQDVQNYKQLRRDERSTIVKGLFKSKYKWKGQNLILVDDVVTSGATIRECIHVLQQSGAGRIIPVAFGKDQQTIDRKLCPVCGRTMSVRRRKSDGLEFWGCSAYPSCKHTENIL